MKDATGELSTTVITVVAIAAIATIFTLILLPMLRNTIKQRTYCSAAYDCVEGTDSMTCKYIDDKQVEQTITCPIQDAGNTSVIGNGGAGE